MAKAESGVSYDQRWGSQGFDVLADLVDVNGAVPAVPREDTADEAGSHFILQDRAEPSRNHHVRIGGSVQILGTGKVFFRRLRTEGFDRSLVPGGMLDVVIIHGDGFECQ